VYTHTDGTRWRTGIRWYYGGEYHKAPPKRLRDGTRYQIFVPVDGDGPWRLHTLANDAKLTSDPVELRARFEVGGWQHMGPPFDPKGHGGTTGTWAGR
jgi:hypothetical protein